MNAFIRLRGRLVQLAATYDFLIFYALSIALGRGLSIFVLPVTSRFIPPGDYARLDVAGSVIEICGLVAGFALSDLIFRFAGSAKSDADQKRVASEILGVGLVVAAVTLVVSQTVLPLFASSLSIGVSDLALRTGLVAATCSGLIEMPLAWLRLRNRPSTYLAFIALRSLTQIFLMIVVLMLGHGPEGVIISNASVDAVLTVYFVFRQIRECGLSFSRAMMRHALHYSTPIVVGGLAMFGLGTCDRFFLAGTIPAAALAQYTLAGKFAFATPLLLQPFALWWNPRRIAVLGEAGGVERSSRIIGYGFVALMFSAAATIYAGTLFIAIALPAAYHEAIIFLPLIVLVTGLNEVATLVNVGAFARTHGRDVLYVNGAGGVVAVLGYLALVPPYGILGAIGATILGHLVRVALFLALGRRIAPIAYPLGGVAVMTASLAALVCLQPAGGSVLVQLLFAAASFAVIAVEAHAFGLLPALPLRAKAAAMQG